MSQPQQDLLKEITAFFDLRPELEFFVGEVQLDLIRAASAAGWIYALASEPSTDTREVRFMGVREGETAIPVIVRRADPTGAFPTPSMIVMDGGFPLPPLHLLPNRAMRDRGTESFGAFVWQLAIETRKSGGTVRDAFAAEMLAMAHSR